MITTGIPLATAVSTGWTRALGVERGQDDAVDPGRDRVLDELDLLDAIVFLLRALPDHLDVAQLLRGLHGARVDRLPELVRRPLGDHHHPPLLRLRPRKARAVALSAWGGWTKAFMSGSFMFSGVTMTSPVEILPLDRLLLEVLDQRLDAQLAHLERVLNDDSLDRPAFQGIHDRLAGVETDQVHAPGRPPGSRRAGPAGLAFLPLHIRPSQPRSSHRSRPTRFART